MKPYFYIAPKPESQCGLMGLHPLEGIDVDFLMPEVQWWERTSARFESFYSTVDQPYGANIEVADVWDGIRRRRRK